MVHFGWHIVWLWLGFVSSRRNHAVMLLGNMTEQNEQFLRGIKIAEEAEKRPNRHKITPQTLKSIRGTIYKFTHVKRR